MKKLSKGQLKERDELATKLDAARQELENRILAFNREATHQFGFVENAMETYKAAVEEAKAFTEGIAEEMTNYFDDRSEKWQDGDAGGEYQSWKDEWENADLDSVEEIVKPDIDMPDGPDGDTLTSLPESP